MRVNPTNALVMASYGSLAVLKNLINLRTIFLSQAK